MFGSVTIPGAKNSVLPLMAASILCCGTVKLTNVPRLSDVSAALEILLELGCKARLCVEESALVIDAQTLQGSAVPERLMRVMRSSLFFLAPLLARTGRAEISQPGGCRLGARPIDIHLDGLIALGAGVEQADGRIIVTAPNGLRGADYTLRFPSVGATETLLMAAVTARGRTVLRGVAREPEITDLIRFLQSAGAHIAGAETNVLYIDGNSMLTGTTHMVCSDRITTATVLCAVAGCGGEALLLNCNPQYVLGLLPLLQTLGCVFSTTGSTSMCVASGGVTKGIGTVFTDIYPALSTDAAPLLMAATLRASGQSRCTDTIFERRFACAESFCALGAHAVNDDNSLVVQGVKRLHGAVLHAQDLRGGAALVLAAMQAQGESVIDGVHYIARGYEDIVEMFASLGADISYGAGAALAMPPLVASFARCGK